VTRSWRRLRMDERNLVEALTAEAGLPSLSVVAPGEVQVSDLSDGGMGSLELLPPGVDATVKRRMGWVAAELEFTDSDGIPVLASLDLDESGRLFELDMFKADFSPLVRISLELRRVNRSPDTFTG